MYCDCNSYTITLVILVIGIQDLYISKYKDTIILSNALWCTPTIGESSMGRVHDHVALFRIHRLCWDHWHNSSWYTYIDGELLCCDHACMADIAPIQTDGKMQLIIIVTFSKSWPFFLSHHPVQCMIVSILEMKPPACIVLPSMVNITLYHIIILYGQNSL